MGKESFCPGMCQVVLSAQELRALLAEIGLCLRSYAPTNFKDGKPKYVRCMFHGIVREVVRKPVSNLIR